MKEIDVVQAYYDAINLAYTASTWWLTISTALVVATYFAAKHIPGWLFAISLVLYALTAASAIFEIRGYSALGEHYAAGIAATFPAWQGSSAQTYIAAEVNSAVNYAFFVLATISAAAYSFVTWRGARRSAAPGRTDVQAKQSATVYVPLNEPAAG